MSKHKKPSGTSKVPLNAQIRALVDAEVERINWFRKNRDESGRPFVDVRKEPEEMDKIIEQMKMTHGNYDKDYVKNLAKKK
jgi:hypothetical protein